MRQMETVKKIKIVIAKEFSKTPGPRHIKEGEHSGEMFRQDILLPRLKEAISGNVKLWIDFDGTAGYGTSFLEEAFGGLIRKEGYTYDTLSKILEFKSDEEEYLKEDIDIYMKEAQDEKKK